MLLFTVNKDNWPIRRFESREHHNAKWTFTSQDHKIIKISTILQAWCLYSVNIYKYDIFLCYLCIRKHCTKERICCIGKIHHPTKFRAFLEIMHHSDSLVHEGFQAMQSRASTLWWTPQRLCWRSDSLGILPKIQADKSCDTVCG